MVVELSCLLIKLCWFDFRFVSQSSIATVMVVGSVSSVSQTRSSREEPVQAGSTIGRSKSGGERESLGVESAEEMERRVRKRRGRGGIRNVGNECEGCRRNEVEGCLSITNTRVSSR